MRTHALILFVVLATTITAPLVATADENFSIVINGRSGATLLRNDSSSTINLDGYLLRSPGVDVLDPGTWSSLQNSPATPGWLESFSSGNRLGEANLFGFTPMAPGATLNIGSPYVPFEPTAIGEQEPGLGTMDFTYSIHEGGSFAGDVEFIDRNSVVLVVDPMSGAASLQNQSEFAISIDSYRILSVPAVLDADDWMPLEISLGEVGGWTASTGLPSRIAEGNLFGSTPLAANGGSLSLGEPIDPDLLNDETDLILEYTVTGLGSLDGGVLFAAAPSDLDGDYNGDGVVDAADYTVWRNNLGDLDESNLNFNGDGDDVSITDYAFWKQHYGDTLSPGGGAGSGSLAVTVPEPATWTLFGIAGSVKAAWRRRKPIV